MTRERGARHLAGIHSARIRTRRIDSHVLLSGDPRAIPVVFLHGNLTAATCFEELMSGMPARFRCVAPDLRGHGETEDLPVDATRGMRDFSDDLHALLTGLGIDSAHLAGWSAGAAAAMQFALDYPGSVRSLCLIAPVSPYGFGATHSVDGIPANEDCSGSGAGAVNAEAVEQLRQRHAEDDAPMAPLHLLRNYFVVPGTHLNREGELLAAMFRQKLGDKRYPGDSVPSAHWPYFAPGRWGLMNAISPKYFNARGLVDLPDKPPVMWIRGEADRIISDQSAFDMGAHAPPGGETSSGKAAQCQPMIGQTRHLLGQFEERGGRVTEVVLPATGHAPFLEQPEKFVSAYLDFLDRCERAG